MPKDIVWSPLAEKDLENILEYLAANWSQKVIVRFLIKIDFVSSQIAKSPQQFPLINKKFQVRKCVVTKQNTLFYREKETRIEILRLYDTRQNPRKLKFTP